MRSLIDIQELTVDEINELITVANDIIDNPATMAVKSHLRNNLPLVIAPSTNNGLSRKCS